MKESDRNPDLKDVEVFHRINRLRIKVAGKAEGPPGQIPDDRIQKAEEFLGKICDDCRTLMGGVLERLVAGWEKMKTLPESDERRVVAQTLFHLAHEIKDIGGMCKYPLLSYFAESLRDYVEDTDLSVEARRVILQAHVDALQAVFRADIRDETMPGAEELKVAVRQAIEKYR